MPPSHIDTATTTTVTTATAANASALLSGPCGPAPIVIPPAFIARLVV